MSLTPIRITANNPGPMTGRGNNTYLLCTDPEAAVLIDADQLDARGLATRRRGLAGERRRGALQR